MLSAIWRTLIDKVHKESDRYMYQKVCNKLYTSALTPDGGLINGVGTLSQGKRSLTVMDKPQNWRTVTGETSGYIVTSHPDRECSITFCDRHLSAMYWIGKNGTGPLPGKKLQWWKSPPCPPFPPPGDPVRAHSLDGRSLCVLQRFPGRNFIPQIRRGNFTELNLGSGPSLPGDTLGNSKKKKKKSNQPPSLTLAALRKLN